MRSFAELINRLDETTRAEFRKKALVDYLSQTSEEDAIWAIGLLSGIRPKKIIALSAIKILGSKASNLPDWLIEENLNAVGDIIETISLILPTPSHPADESLRFWIKHLLTLEKSNAEGKEIGVLGAWEIMHPAERFVFNKLATGGFRIQVDQPTLSAAIAEVTNISKYVIASRLIKNWNPEKNSFADVFLTPNPDDQLCLPYPFYSTYNLAGKIQTIGNPNEWIAERKWDGIRAQIIIRSEKIFVWTTEGTLITNKCPEFLSLSFLLPNGTVLDGEILARKNDQILSLSQLQSRLSKKSLSKKMANETPLFFMAYDLLELNGRDIRKKAFDFRRAELMKLISTTIQSSDNNDIIEVSPEVIFTSWRELENELSQSRNFMSIGLVLKNKNAIYKEGRQKGEWWKWKAKPMSIKTVLLYVQSDGWGRGKANYTFAVKKGDELIPVTKTLDGLSETEIKEIAAFARKNTVEKFGPVRSVKPALVFEITFEAIQISSRHKCGIVLRNPAIQHWHKDLEPSQIDTLEDVKALLNEYGGG